MKFLLDENVSPNLRAALQKQWPGMIVWAVGDPGAPTLSTLDPEILVWCEENDYALVTNNRASMPQHLHEHLLAGRHVPGIIILKSTQSIGATVEDLAIIWAATDPDEYKDRMEWLPL